MDVRIDTSRYEAELGKPKGKRHWAFTIVSPSAAARDKYFRVPEPMTFEKARDKALELARLRRSVLIVLERD